MKIVKTYEKFGLFDKLKSSKSKILDALNHHGYSNQNEFLKDVEKVNSYCGMIGMEIFPLVCDIKNIQLLYKTKLEFNDVFEAADELKLLLQECHDEGVEININYREYSSTSSGGSYSSPSRIPRRNFELKLKPKVFDVTSLYLIFGVLMETEGRGEIKFEQVSAYGDSVITKVFIDEEQKSTKSNHQGEYATALTDFEHNILDDDVIGGAYLPILR